MQKEPEVNRQNLEEIGRLLFELLTADISEVQRQTGWVIFEQKLRQYYSKRKNNQSVISGQKSKVEEMDSHSLPSQGQAMMGIRELPPMKCPDEMPR